MPFSIPRVNVGDTAPDPTYIGEKVKIIAIDADDMVTYHPVGNPDKICHTGMPAFSWVLLNAR
jgi:hypothetical protein